MTRRSFFALLAFALPFVRRKKYEPPAMIKWTKEQRAILAPETSSFFRKIYRDPRG